MSALDHLVGASRAQRPLADRLPRRQPMAAWVIAVVATALIVLVARLIDVPPATVLFVTLLVVVVAALLGGVRPALTAIAVGLVAQWAFFTFPYGSLTDHDPEQLSVLVVFVIIGAGVGILVDELARLTREQAALRRIATLVALGRSPAELFSAVAHEVAALLAADGALVAHLDPDGFATIVAEGHTHGRASATAGERWQVEPPMALAAAVRTRRPARTDDYEHASPDLRARIRRMGIRSSVATPIIVEGHVWGGIVASKRQGMLPADSEQRMLNFTEIVATAIANADSRSELAASRSRIVAASDQARRQVERDLHDGVQQRLVSLALEVRAAQSALPPADSDVRAELTGVVDGLNSALEEVREIARGLHPAILSAGGLGPALRTLARRAPLPVALDLRVEDELSDGVEVAAYYAVSELITNTAKHAQASSIDVAVTSVDGVLRIVARDDGIGGADPARGSGLIGLRDRIETLGGAFSVRSPRGQGTTVEVALPLSGDRHGADNLHDLLEPRSAPPR
jgi:signal transduction histidine kinase